MLEENWVLELVLHLAQALDFQSGKELDLVWVRLKVKKKAMRWVLVLGMDLLCKYCLHHHCCCETCSQYYIHNGKYDHTRRLGAGCCCYFQETHISHAKYRTGEFLLNMDGKGWELQWVPLSVLQLALKWVSQ